MSLFCTGTQPPNIWNTCVGKLNDNYKNNHSAKESHSHCRTINKVWYRSHTEPLFKCNQILKFEDMYTMQISLFVYDLNNDLLPKSFRNLLSQNCLARHGIITRQNNLIPQSRPRTTFSSKLPKHNFTRIWNKTGSTLAHGKNRLTFKRLLKNSYLEAYRSQIKCFNPRCTDCCDNI